jgi:DNA helicase II / ATP-dependent DNA helicase PcrA
MIEQILEGLNDKQREAVLAGEGPLLILAGAGSGKTRVIAHRIAYLLEEKRESPFNILAVTFTNKAANEMKERVLRLLGRDSVPFLWIGTFHAIGVRMLREDIDKLELGINKNFTIFDRDDSKALIKKILKEEGIDDDKFSPQEIIEYFSRLKRNAAPAKAKGPVLAMFDLYQKRLVESNGCDFDDLLLYSLRLIRDVKEVRARYQERFRHVLVDEYQDTNDVQEEMLSLLSEKWNNLFVVGDEDQAIYSFRGSQVHHIVDFPKRYEHAKTVRLEQNYRSISNILKASSALVAHNQERLGKNLWTDKAGGDKILFFPAPSDREEGAYVGDKIRELNSNHNYNQIAVLVRTNAQSRSFEEAFLNRKIPYQIVGGLKFYERKEIKDVLAYIRIALNPFDRVSLLRIINYPPRGIGKSTIEEIETLGMERNITLFQAVKTGLEEHVFGTRAAAALSEFMKLVEALGNKAKELKPFEVTRWVIEKTALIEHLESQTDLLKEDRIENIEELVSAMKEFEVRERGDLQTFLERQALQSDQDELGDGAAEIDRVKLMTIHTAKGLEFPVVFIVGLEDGYFPHELSKGNEAELEEERRLLYVGMTRAMEKLIMTNSATRYIYGQLKERLPSPFIGEIPAEHLKLVSGLAPARKPSWGNMNLHHAYSNSKKHTDEVFFQEQTHSDPAGKFRPGVRVHHKTFGVGMILSTEGSGENLKIAVSFSRFGKKTLLARIAKLDIM